MRLIDADALIEEIKMDIEDAGLQEKMVFYRINEAPSAEPSDGDLISRADAIEAVFAVSRRVPTMAIRAKDALDSLPSASVEQTDCTEFVNWLLDEVMDEDNWELNAVANGEIICRKLKKLGLLEVKDGYYIRPSIEVVQGEWTYLSGSKGSYMTISCPICGSTFDGVAEWKYHYCPNCGARMKGGEDE